MLDCFCWYMCTFKCQTLTHSCTLARCQRFRATVQWHVPFGMEKWKEVEQIEQFPAKRSKSMNYWSKLRISTASISVEIMNVCLWRKFRWFEKFYKERLVWCLLTSSLQTHYVLPFCSWVACIPSVKLRLCSTPTRVSFRCHCSSSLLHVIFSLRHHWCIHCIARNITADVYITVNIVQYSSIVLM